jgi:DNA repair protein RadC
MKSAASLIFVHNHPSHDPYPNPEVRLITKKRKEACNVVGIGANDHIIVVVSAISVSQMRGFYKVKTKYHLKEKS